MNCPIQVSPMPTPLLSVFAAVAFLTMIPIASATQDDQRQVTVYTTKKIALHAVPTHTKVIYMDRPLDIEAQMSRDLPSNPHQAAIVMKQRMALPDFTRLHAELQQANADIASAKTLKIEKLPAVVVDAAYVIYGQPNVRAALQQIELARAQP